MERILGMGCKLEEYWRGPLKVKEKLGGVNYNAYECEREAERENSACQCAKTLCGKGVELDKVLDKLSDVLSTIPGRTSVVQMIIDTGDSMPINQVPYKMPDSIKVKVKAEGGGIVI